MGKLRCPAEAGQFLTGCPSASRKLLDHIQPNSGQLVEVGGSVVLINSASASNPARTSQRWFSNLCSIYRTTVRGLRIHFDVDLTFRTNINPLVE